LLRQRFVMPHLRLRSRASGAGGRNAARLSSDFRARCAPRRPSNGTLLR
jgi:hypothetical protein